MKFYLAAILIISSVASYAADEGLIKSDPSHVWLQEEIKNKSKLLKEMEQRKELQYTTAQTKEYLKELEALEKETKQSNFDKHKLSIDQKHNVFTEVYYQ